MGPTPSLTTENLPFSSGDSEYLRSRGGDWEMRLRCVNIEVWKRCWLNWFYMFKCIYNLNFWLIYLFDFYLIFDRQFLILFFCIWFDCIWCISFDLVDCLLVWFKTERTGPCTTKSHPFSIRFFDSKNCSPKNQQSTTTWLHRLFRTFGTWTRRLGKNTMMLKLVTNELGILMDEQLGTGCFLPGWFGCDFGVGDVWCGVYKGPRRHVEDTPIVVGKRDFFSWFWNQSFWRVKKKTVCFVLDSWVFTCFFRHKFGMLVFTTRGAIWSPMGPDSLGDENDHHGY